MVPTVVLVGLVLGRWWWQTPLAAAVAWSALLLAADTITPGAIPAAMVVGAANAGAGVLVHQGVRRAGRRLPRRLDAAAVGATAVSGALVLASAGVGELTLVDALLLTGILVVVPLALPLFPAGSARHATVAVVAGLPAVAAVLLSRGPAGALLALPWFGVAVVGALLTARRWWRTRPGPATAVWPVAAGYLVVGAAWLVADRLDLAPAGVTAPFVQLTAVHFHFAGFGAAVLAGCTWRRVPSRGTATAVALVLAGPPVVATGFLVHGALQVAGAVLLAAGLWTLAWQVVRHAAPRVGGRAGVLLVVSALATLAPMVLAVQWALGSALGTPALSIAAMARWHGIANALGLVVLGLLGWRLAAVRAR